MKTNNIENEWENIIMPEWIVNTSSDIRRERGKNGKREKKKEENVRIEGEIILKRNRESKS